MDRSFCALEKYLELNDHKKVKCACIYFDKGGLQGRILEMVAEAGISVVPIKVDGKFAAKFNADTGQANVYSGEEEKIYSLFKLKKEFSTDNVPEKVNEYAELIGRIKENIKEVYYFLAYDSPSGATRVLNEIAEKRKIALDNTEINFSDIASQLSKASIPIATIEAFHKLAETTLTCCEITPKSAYVVMALHNMTSYLIDNPKDNGKLSLAMLKTATEGVDKLSGKVDKNLISIIEEKLERLRRQLVPSVNHRE